MNYLVDVNGSRTSVLVGPDGVGYLGEAPIVAELADTEAGPITMLRLGEEVYRIVLQRREGKGKYTLWVDGYRFEIDALDERTRAIRDMTRANATTGGPAPIVAPMPGLIVRVRVNPGDEVEPGQGVVVMEAMKMENELRATSRGVVKSVDVLAGTAVEKGALLVTLEG